MADEIQSNPRKKMGLVGKIMVYIVVPAAIMGLGLLYGKYSNGIKNLAVRDLNGDYNKEDIIITHNDGNKEAFIQQDNKSYITWDEARKKLYKSIDDSVNQIENEIKK